MVTRMLDASGRITIGKKLAKEYGRKFVMVTEPNRIKLIPYKKFICTENTQKC